MAQYVYNQPQTMPTATADTTLNKVGSITGAIGGLINSIDRAIHPGKYRSGRTSSFPNQTSAQTGQTQPQPERSGMGTVGKVLVIGGLAGGAVWAGKKMMDSEGKGEK